MSKKPNIYDYFVLIYMPKHPRAFASGYVPEQILVAEQSLKRSLTLDEEVRHINGEVQDNRPENLEIISPHAGYKVQSVGEFPFDSPTRVTQNKTFIPCKFQKPCWREIRAPLARANKIYLPYVCSWSMEGDIYHCGHFWNFLDKEMEKEKGTKKKGVN